MTPDSADDLRRGAALAQSGQLAEAASVFLRITTAHPQHVEAWCRLAMVRETQRRWADAAAAYRHALEVQPGFAEVHCNLGTVLLRAENYAEAEEAFARAIALKPAFPEALNGLGVAQKSAGKLEAAEQSFRAAATARPLYRDAHYNLGNTLQLQQRWGDAIESYHAALTLDPDSLDLLHNLGCAFCGAKFFAEAAQLQRQVLARKPDMAEAHNNLGNALLGLNDLSGAEQAFRHALSLKPNYIEALCNLGNVLLAQNLPVPALELYRKAQEISPTFPEAHFNESIALLLLGKLRDGFAKYEWRWQTEQKHLRRTFFQPRWTGAEPLQGKTILVHCEQGMGDTLQFARYIPQLVERGAHVLFEVQAPLVPLFHHLPNTVVLCRKQDAPHHFDFHLPLLSLPEAFQTELATIPSGAAYLKAGDAAVSRWAERLAPYAGRRVGLVCSGNARHKSDHNRSIPLQAFESLAAAIGGSGKLHLVQKDIKAADAETLARSGAFVDWSAQLTDFAETAGLLANLDLVVTVDTSVAHLAGAMGRPTWVLLPYAPDWRWMLNREDSPWYPTVRLFRQPRPGDWESVIAAVAAKIRMTNVE